MKMFDKTSVYFTFAKAQLKVMFAYKASILMNLIGRFWVLIMTFLLWKAIYSSSDSGVMSGFTIEEMLCYILISFFIGGAVFSDVSYIINDEVKDGSIAMNLIKPIDYTKRLFFLSLGGLIFAIGFFLIPGGIITFIYGSINNVSFSFISFIFFFISIFLGFLINFYYSHLFGLLSFKFYNIWGVSQISQNIINLVSGALIPLAFFPEIVRNIFALLPFGSMIYTPSMIFLNKYSMEQIVQSLLVQVFWIIVLRIITKVCWNKVIKNLCIQGG